MCTCVYVCVCGRRTGTRKYIDVLYVICVSSPTVFFSDRVYRFYIYISFFFLFFPPLSSYFSFFLSTLESFNTTQWLTTFCWRLMTRRIVCTFAAAACRHRGLYLFTIHKSRVYIYMCIRDTVVFFNNQVVTNIGPLNILSPKSWIWPNTFFSPKTHSICGNLFFWEIWFQIVFNKISKSCLKDKTKH